jgi:TPR repeat protein
MRILRPLADQGDGMAETIVGSMYYFNQGVPLDWVSAYMWFSLAAAHGTSLGAFFLEQMTRKMTQREIAETQQRVREWKPTKQPQ